MESGLTEQLLDKIDQYLKGSLSTADHVAFEEEILKNKELQEEVTLQKQLLNVLNDKNWISIKNDKDNNDLTKVKEQFKSKEYQDASTLIRQIGQTTKTKKKTPIRKLYYRYAMATAAILLIFFSVLFINSNSELNTLYKDYAHWDTELVSFVEQSNTADSFSNGEIAFRKKEYKDALQYFLTIKKEEKQYPYALMYIGASYELLQENDNALKTFDSLIAMPFFEENSKGYWYKLLIYLKQNDRVNAQKMIAIILENKQNHNYSKALELSKILE